MRFRSSVAIDLGTVNTLIWVTGRGIVLEEPTAIAIDTSVGKVAAVGEEADALADKEPQDIEVIHPLRDGVIADLDATAALLHAFLRRSRRFGIGRPDALVCVPSGATPVERRSIVAALGVRRPRYHVRLIEEPVAAAAGAGFDLTGGAGGFVVDIGGGTTEVAAVAGWRVVRSVSLRKAGNTMDDAIVQTVRSDLGLIISQRAARQLKMALGVTGGAEGWGEAVGLDVAQRTPRAEHIPGSLVARALEPVVAAIAGAVQEMLSDIPAGLAEDVVRGKIRLAGGGALLPGLASRIETTAGIGTVLVEDPLRCVVRGAAELLERKEKGRHAAPGIRTLNSFIPNGPGCSLFQRADGSSGCSRSADELRLGGRCIPPLDAAVGGVQPADHRVEPVQLRVHDQGDGHVGLGLVLLDPGPLLHQLHQVPAVHLDQVAHLDPRDPQRDQDLHHQFIAGRRGQVGRRAEPSGQLDRACLGETESLLRSFGWRSTGICRVRLDQAVPLQPLQRGVDLAHVQRPHLTGPGLELLAKLQPVLRALAQQREQGVPDTHPASRSRLASLSSSILGILLDIGRVGQGGVLGAPREALG
jgi:rod shape-determining protein MreB